MESDLNLLLASLKTEVERLLGRNSMIKRDIYAMEMRRKMLGRKCIEELLPSLSNGAVKRLKALVPGFEIEAPVAGWSWRRPFSFKRNKSETDLSKNRIRLSSYLESAENVPEMWDRVRKMDGQIRKCREENEDNLASTRDILAAIDSLEKFKDIDHAKMDPTLVKKLGLAIHDQAERIRLGERIQIFNKNGAAPFSGYSGRERGNPNPRANLIDEWLWRQLLADKSEFCREVRQLAS